MTDKQIINDVQECEFLQEGHCNLYFNSEISDISPNCIDISECNYKQLKAKYNEFVSRYKAKEQECEELKHKVELMMDCASCKIDEYKQTLIEIKEIAEPFCNACQEHEPEKSGRDCMYCNYGKILQKIKECEVENA